MPGDEDGDAHGATLRRRRELREAPAGRGEPALGDQLVDAREHVVGARARRTRRRRAARRSRAARRPSSARRAGSRPRGCGRPRAGRARRRRGSRRRDRRGRPAGCSPSGRALPPPAAPRAPRETVIDVTSATDSGAQTSQQATTGLGAAGRRSGAGSPRGGSRRPRRTPRSSGTGASARGCRPPPTCGRSRARGRRTAPRCRPRTRSIGAGDGPQHAGAHEVADDRADLLGLGAERPRVGVDAPVRPPSRAAARRRGRSRRRRARRAR